VSDTPDTVTEKVPFSRVVERSICLDTNTHAWCAVCNQYERQVCYVSLYVCLSLFLLRLSVCLSVCLSISLSLCLLSCVSEVRPCDAIEKYVISALKIFCAQLGNSFWCCALFCICDYCNECRWFLMFIVMSVDGSWCYIATNVDGSWCLLQRM